MITNKNYNVDFAKMSDKKLMYDFAKEMSFVRKTTGKKSTRVRTLIKFFKLPGLMASASGISIIMTLSSDTNELCDRLKLKLQVRKPEIILSFLIKKLLP